MEHSSWCDVHLNLSPDVPLFDGAVTGNQEWPDSHKLVRVLIILSRQDRSSFGALRVASVSFEVCHPMAPLAQTLNPPIIIAGRIEQANLLMRP